MKLKVAVGLLIVVILSLTVLGDRGLLNLIKLKRETHALAQERNRLAAENERLRLKVERLANDRDYIERFAREELGMVKPGEYVLQFPEPPEER